MYIIPVPPDEDVITGSSMFFGNLERTEFTFAKISASAAFGSVFSFIFTVMAEEFGALLEDI